MDITKICKLCNEMKPITEFYKNKNTGYYHSYCLPCESKKRQTYVTNGNYIYKVKYLEKYPEDIRNYVRESIKNPDYDIKEISNHTGISKPTLLSWIKNNRI
jgi:hypothetical protein